MKINPEDAPSFIFDWMEKKNFASLASPEKQKVLQYFTEEDYEAMHQCVISIKAVSSSNQSSREARKQELLQRFDRNYPKVKTNFTFANMFWKAAAVFLLFGTGWLSHYLIIRKNVSSLSVIPGKDTIYIMNEKVSAPVKIFDTVYIEKETPPTSGNKVNYRTRGVKKQSYDAASNLYETTNILSVKEAGNKANASKGNSMKEDSLHKKFTFVSL